MTLRQPHAQNPRQQAHPYQLADLEIGGIQELEAVRGEDEDGEGEEGPLGPVEEGVGDIQRAEEVPQDPDGSALPPGGQQPHQGCQQQGPGDGEDPGRRRVVGRGGGDSHLQIDPPQPPVQPHQGAQEHSAAQAVPQPVAAAQGLNVLKNFLFQSDSAILSSGAAQGAAVSVRISQKRSRFNIRGGKLKKV